MKNLLIVSLVLICASSAFGAVVNFTAPVTEVVPSQNILISVVLDAQYGATALTMDRIVSSNGGEASQMSLNTAFSLFPSAGTAVNSGGVLISGVDGAVSGVGVFARETLYSFMFHVPALPVSSYIDISAVNNGTYYGAAIVQGVGEVTPGALRLHVAISEPMTMALLAIGGLVALRRRHA